MKALILILVLAMVASASYFPTCNAFKVHRTVTEDSPTLDAWTDCDKFVQVDSETGGWGVHIGADSTHIIADRAGLYQFGGCVHYQNGSGGGVDALVACRILLNGTDEARCSQRAHNLSTPAGGESVLSYTGTVTLAAGDSLTLQYYTDNATIDFTSNAVFDEQVAWTLWLIRCGD